MLLCRREMLGYGTAVLAGGMVARGESAAPRRQAESPRSMAGFPESDFYGVAAEFDEVLAVQRRIESGDAEQFLKAWTDMAQSVERKADGYLAEGRRASAHEAYLRASNYYSRVQQALLRVGDGVRIIQPYRAMREAWRKAWALATPPFEEVQIPFADTTLPGLFAPLARCEDGRMPVILHLSGSDHINERTYFRSEWQRFHNRGFSYMTLEGPGQGEPLRLRKLFLQPDYETVAASALDYLATRPDVDMKRVGVFSTAFGGYFAAQAGVDPRVRAVACRSASFDLWEDAYQFAPVVRRHLEYMLGVEGEDAARRALQSFRLDAVAPRIRAPIAIYHGGRDKVQDPRGAQRLYDAIPGREKILKIPPDGPRNVGRELELELVDWLTMRVSPSTDAPSPRVR